MYIIEEDEQGQQLFLGRQPIVDRNKNLVAFELLFRSGQQTNGADFLCGFRATATVIHHIFNELGIEAALGACIGLINVNEEMLADEVLELLPRSKIIFEILESVKITDAVIARCQQLKSLGHQLALDDVTSLDEDSAGILKHISIVKVDISLIEENQLGRLVSRIRAHNPAAKLLAEKVETLEQFAKCLALGFDLFQGYFFARPQIISGRRMSMSELAILKLLEQVSGDAELAEIEKTLKENAALSISLLKIANSAFTGARRTISSIREAVAILGRRQLHRWVQLLLYASTGQDKLSPLLLLAATRGRAMEMVAKEKHESAFEDHAFITGIMSLLDTLLGMPLNEALAQVQLHQHITDALLKREGDLGKLLQLIEHIERGDEGSIQQGIAHFPYLNPGQLQLIHAESMLWANAICQGKQ
jgi:EAL and modified HD-GYP domain-containing signal transduction protein